MSGWPLVDPAPDSDLDSDIAFGTWLEGLDPSEVQLDRSRGMPHLERERLAYMRKRAIQYSPPQGETPTG